jgi:hypothetical protein
VQQRRDGKSATRQPTNLPTHRTQGYAKAKASMHLEGQIRKLDRHSTVDYDPHE